MIFLEMNKTIFFFITDQCNYRCAHCYYPVKYRNVYSEKNIIINILKKLLDTEINEFRLTGGEPLTCTYLFEIIDLIYKSDKQMTITTNVSLLSPQILRKLIYNHKVINSIWVSLYGADEKNYEYITKQEGSYRIFRKNVKILTKCGFNVGINASIGFGNLSKWLETLTQLTQEGIKRFKILWTAPNGKAAINWPGVS